MSVSGLEMTLHRAAGAPRRWWRAKGFGVHSPFAYGFVRDVLGQPCRYYAYDEADRVAVRRGLPRRMARLLVRIGVWAWSPSAAVLSAKPGVDEVLMTCRSDMRTTEMPLPDCTLIVIGAERAANGGVSTAVDAMMMRGGTIVLLDADNAAGASATALSRIKETAGHGMLFGNGKHAVFVARPTLPRQNFEVWL